jgi:hypothetical protein
MTLAKGLLLAALTVAAGRAGTLTFTETMTTNGILDGTTFTNELVTLNLTANTSSIAIISPVLYYLVGSASVTVASVGSDTFTDEMVEVSNTSVPWGGFGDLTSNLIVLFIDDPAFSSYTLDTPLGPVSDVAYGNSGSTYNTSGGYFEITGPLDGSDSATFTAVAAPEPGTLAMLGAGISLLVLGRRMVR